MNPHDRVVLIQEEPRGASQLLEIPVTASGSQRVYFPDSQQLRSLANQQIIVKAMRLVPLYALSGGMLNALPNAPQSELVNMSLVIYSEGWEKGQYIPIYTLNDFSTSNTTDAHRYTATKFNNWFNVDWPKSYIQYANGTQSNIGETAGYVVLLDIEYLKLNAAGKEILGAS